MTHLTATHHVDHVARQLEQLAADTTAPKPVRVAATEWARVAATVAEHHRHLERVGKGSRAALAAAKGDAPGQYLEQLAAGVAVDPDTLGDHLAQLRAELDRAEDRYAISTRAVGAVPAGVRAAVLAPHVEPLAQWIADHRTGTPWWEPVADHVGWVHAITSRTYRVQLPTDAATITTTDGTPHTVRGTVSLILDHDAGGELPYARHHWAWSAIAAGRYEWTPATTTTGRARVRITADYETRAPLPPRPTTPAGGRARRMVARLAA